MNTLSHGLNIQKPKKPVGPPKPKGLLAGFAPDDTDHDDGDDDDDSTPTLPKSKPKLNTKQEPTAASKEKARMNSQLATFSTLSQKAALAAEETTDPQIYDYDGVWDDMKSVDRVKAAAEEADAAERKPKYMASLLEAAEVRKRDALRAKERTLQKEREAEGEEFVDKEAFVTEAYKKQQEVLLKLEEEERVREEKMLAKSQGMSSFYRNMLDKTESKHTLMVAASTAPRDPKSTRAPAFAPATKTQAELAAEKGAEVNDEGVVVDKTHLLSGGLNVSAKPRLVPSSRGNAGGDRRRAAYQGVGARREDVRARQSRMVQEQLAAAHKRALEQEEEERKELERASKSRKTEGDVKGAKERYLQRKREAEEAKKKGD